MITPEVISTLAILSVFGLFAAFGATKIKRKPSTYKKNGVTVIMLPEQTNDDRESTDDLDDISALSNVITIEHAGNKYDVELTPQQAQDLLEELKSEEEDYDEILGFLNSLPKINGGKTKKRLLKGRKQKFTKRNKFTTKKRRVK